MAGNKVIRPVDVVGSLPELAAAELVKQDAHAVSVVRLGALTFDELDIGTVDGPTVSQRQSSESCLALVLFFNRYSISENILEAKTHLDLTPDVRFFARGCVLQHGHMVQYVGSFTDPRRCEVKWIALPSDIKRWFNDETKMESVVAAQNFFKRLNNR